MPGRPNHFLDALENTEDGPNPFLSRLQRTTLLEDPFEEYDIYKQDLTLSDTARPLACLANAVIWFESPSRVKEINMMQSHGSSGSVVSFTLIGIVVVS